MKELEFHHDDTLLKYKFKPRKYDCRHLIVIFSGFGASSEFTYDFENALQDCPANVLWIKDDFSGHCSYYLLKDGNNSPELAVQKLITSTLESLNLEKEDCTLAGFSKGGSAALYHGIKYDFRNIVSTVPQMNIARYAIENWPQTAANMFGAMNSKEIDAFDKSLANLIRKDKLLSRNIYLLTSESDVQYPTEIEPFRGEFLKYSNFNFFLSRSVLVRAHNQVTSHHSSLLISILYSLSNNAIPRYGYVELSGDIADESKKTDIGSPIISLKTFQITSGKLFLEGVGILKHVAAHDWKDVKYQLRLVDTDKSAVIDVNLAKDSKPSLTRQFYSESITSYDKAWFCTVKHEGLDVSTIPSGKYQCFLRIIMTGHEHIAKLSLSNPSTTRSEDSSILAECSTNGVFLLLTDTKLTTQPISSKLACTK